MIPVRDLFTVAVSCVFGAGNGENTWMELFRRDALSEEELFGLFQLPGPAAR